MASISMLDGLESPPVTIVLSPQGRLHAERHAGAGTDLPPSLEQVVDQFARGDGHGLFRLGAAEPETALPGILGFWRDVGRAFVARLSATEDLEQLRERVHVDVPADEVAALVSAAPPMPGGEYLTAAVIEDLYARMTSAVKAELAEWEGTVESFLRAASLAWNPVGRVCFHLAENKNDPEAPFAFVATYTTRLSAKAKARTPPRCASTWPLPSTASAFAWTRNPSCSSSSAASTTPTW